ncbi:helix-turn-helix domain-containing protein [Marinomonas pollencensis]|uniref:AraC family transcriptional regulator n=1 Tax=Marinomonas pollencensis TaxID=491954 RepID=A0A3E0DM83_9GAMM|nr:helix-turn-helix domain-containing protein [Marinomonas pollencensis]REG83222.1 AraC family transcriptional regulator [Marinomonas pollencensis]
MQKIIPNYRVYGQFDVDFSLNPVHIDSVRRSTEVNDWVIEPHRHDDLCHLVCFFSGTGRMHLNHTFIPLNTPCCCFVPAGDVHSFEVQENIEGTIVTVSQEYLNDLLASAESGLPSLDEAIVIERDEQDSSRSDILALFRLLASEYKNRHPARGLAMRSLLGLIFSQMMRANNALPTHHTGSDKDRNLWYYRQFQRLVSHSFADKKPISEYAMQLRISVTHLNRISQAVTGKSALNIIHDRIISEAKVNLAYSFQSVSEVAYQLGFDDISYFSRFFKKHTGLSPKAFKDRVIRQQPILMDTSE